MSEVKCFKVDLPGQFDRNHVRISAWVVMRSDFDAQRLRADTAEAERDEAMETLEFNTNCWDRERAVMIDKNQTLTADLLECGLRRKAAEQRIAELSANNQQLRKLLEQSLAALNPTKNLSKSIRAALNQKSEGESHE